jgi:hypothetical protein
MFGGDAACEDLPIYGEGYIHCGGAFETNKLIGRTTGPILRAPFKRPFNAITPS